MALRSYRSLATNSRYLHGIVFDSGESNLAKEDRLDAEDQAATEIDTALGKSFSTGANTPPLVRVLADLIGSAIVLEYRALSTNFGGENAEGARKPEWLRKKAKQVLDDLRAHTVGIQNVDGTWDASYPQPSILPTIGVGAAKNITVDAGLTWGQMAQGQMTDAEKTSLDPERGRRANDLEAALAGAYGL